MNEPSDGAQATLGARSCAVDGGPDQKAIGWTEAHRPRERPEITSAPVALVESYLAMLAGEPDRDIFELLHEQFEQVDVPGRNSPFLVRRSAGDLYEDWSSSRQLLEWEQVRLHQIVERNGSIVAVVDWSGRRQPAANDGPHDTEKSRELSQRLALVFTLRDGKILRQRNYEMDSLSRLASAILEAG